MKTIKINKILQFVIFDTYQKKDKANFYNLIKKERI